MVDGARLELATSALRTRSARSRKMFDVDALRRQQQRILHRSALIDYVLAAETARAHR